MVDIFFHIIIMATAELAARSYHAFPVGSALSRQDCSSNRPPPLPPPPRVPAWLLATRPNLVRRQPSVALHCCSVDHGRPRVPYRWFRPNNPPPRRDNVSSPIDRPPVERRRRQEHFGCRHSVRVSTRLCIQRDSGGKLLKKVTKLKCNGPSVTMFCREKRFLITLNSTEPIVYYARTR